MYYHQKILLILNIHKIIVYLQSIQSPFGQRVVLLIIGRLRTFSYVIESRKFSPRRYATERPCWVYDTLTAAAICRCATGLHIIRRGLLELLILGQGMREPDDGIGGQ